MDPAVIVSPHLDDAVLSLGQFMEGRGECVVLSLFTGEPEGMPITTPFDVNSGFDDSSEAMPARRREDLRALTYLGGSARHLGFLDHQYAPDERPTPAAIVDELLERLQRIERVERVLAPLGLAHPDHLRVADACMMLRRRIAPTPMFVYEELPARVLWPELVPPALKRWNITDAQPTFIGTGSRGAKRRAIAQYESQRWALDTHACLVPERVWPCG